MTDIEITITKRDYRAAIRVKWLPVVGRRELNRREYELTEEWFEAQLPLSLVLEAIGRVVKRAEESGKTIYSLGVITADIQALQRQRARMQVGGTPQPEQADWQTQWAEDLESMASETDDPELGAMYRELRAELPKLTRDEAKERLGAIPIKR